VPQQPSESDLGARVDPASRFGPVSPAIKAGVRHMTVHDARRTCETLLVDLEIHPRVIMRILRHADVSMTLEIYANASSTATSEALRRLGESLR
jgi:integrase